MSADGQSIEVCCPGPFRPGVDIVAQGLLSFGGLNNDFLATIAMTQPVGARHRPVPGQ
jgi:hypothetical protein